MHVKRDKQLFLQNGGGEIVIINCVVAIVGGMTVLVVGTRSTAAATSRENAAAKAKYGEI